MDFMNVSQAHGNRISLNRADPRHLPGRLHPQAPASAPGAVPSSELIGAAPAGGTVPGAASASQGPEGSFGTALARALNGVNDLQHVAMQKSQAMVTDPDSVDVHDVTIALAEANLALSITKAIADRALRAYQEIINVR